MKAISLTKFGEANESFYQDYPSLFSGAYPEIDDVLKQKIAAAGFLYYRSVIALDTILDSKEPAAGSKNNGKIGSLVVSICQEQAIQLLSSVFPDGSHFWKKWNKRRLEYLSAYFQEKQFVSGRSCSFETYASIAANKAAFGRVAIDCLREATGPDCEDITTTIMESYRDFSIGLQLLDDLQDFAEDQQTGQLNYFQNALNEYLVEQGQEVPTGPLRKKLLYTTGVAQTGLKIASEHLERSYTNLAQINATIAFTQLVEKTLRTANRTFSQITQYFELIEVKSNLYNQPFKELYNIPEASFTTAREISTDRAIRYIVDQANRSFPEIKHLMYLGPDDGFNNDQQVHFGDVFQRALLLDNLQKVSSNSPKQQVLLNDLLQDEYDYLMNQRLDGPVAGWSYFPTVREIAPDADDLGQMLQCMAGQGDLPTIEKLGKPLVHFLAKHNFHKKVGAYETWLVPRKNRTPLQDIQEDYNQNKWGKGPDPEVVANYLYGVQCAGLAVPASHLECSLKYLASTQHEQGMWESRWYVGPYYGTYTALRLLATTGDHKDEVRAAKKYLLDRQYLPNGSFENSLLHTAIACLALFHCRSLEDKQVSSAIAAAQNYMSEQLSTTVQLPKPTPFIIPKAGLPFGSTTLEMSYVLHALSLNIL